jgi:hypothetical protein
MISTLFSVTLGIFGILSMYMRLKKTFEKVIPLTINVNREDKNDPDYGEMR